MFENFRIPPEFIPIGIASALTGTLRTLIIGRQSWKVALVTWPVAVGTGFAGGWLAKEFGTPPGWDLAAASASAIMGENIIKGLIELSEQFKTHPNGLVERLIQFLRGRDDR
jgi:hypothetical protein